MNKYATFHAALFATLAEVHTEGPASPVNGFWIKEIYPEKPPKAGASYGMDQIRYHVEGECWSFVLRYKLDEHGDGHWEEEP